MISDTLLKAAAPYLAGVLVISFLANGVLVKAWLSGREALAVEVERCNTDKERYGREAADAARKVVQASAERRERELEQKLQDAIEGRKIADLARMTAEDQFAEAQARILSINSEDEDDPDIIGKTCLDVLVPADVDRVRE